MKKNLFVFSIMSIVLLCLLVLGGCVVKTPDAPFIMVEYDTHTYEGVYLATNRYGVVISWAEVPEAQEYIIYYGKNLDTNLFTRLNVTELNHITHVYKREEGKYYYAVKASNSAGTSGFSNVATW
jgi:hypothetical protein